MKKTILKILSTIIFLCLNFITAIAQTNVSGGIYSNTTWTLANSPYIVVDTVVVFPGVTLTIEAGVTVKFAANKQLEIRQASLIALGNVNDSITFTSSGAPIPGFWDAIYVNGGTMTCQFNYCNFKYGSNAIWLYEDSLLSVKNSVFDSNVNGISYSPFLFGGARILIDSCNFTNNTGFGMDVTQLFNYSVINISNCNFYNNNIGLHAYGQIKNCICNNNVIGAQIEAGTVESCEFKYNQTGIDKMFAYTNAHDTVKNCIIDSNSVMGIKMTGRLYNCEIKYNGVGILQLGSQVVQNDIQYNGINIQNYYDPVYGGSIIANNIIKYGNVGIDTTFHGVDAITSNVIENNSVGIVLNSTNPIITCNKICNTQYNLKYATNFNRSVADNYWCTTDSTIIASTIYDGYDNVSLGLVSFTPFDTVGCYMNANNCSANFSLYPDTTQLHHYIAVNNATGIPPLSYHWDWGDGSFGDTAAYPSHIYADSGFYDICLTIVDLSTCTSTYCDTSYHILKTANYPVYINVIPPLPTGNIEITLPKRKIEIYPNPTSNNFTLYAGENILSAQVNIFNLLGERVFSTVVRQPYSNIDISHLKSGIYVLEFSSEKQTNMQKLIKQ